MLNHLPAELQQTVLLPIELSINKVLQHDPSTQKKLSRYQGQVLALSVLLPTSKEPLSVFVRVLDAEVNISLSEQMHFDARLSGSLSDFVSLGLSSNKSNRLINSDIDLSGDTEFAIGLTGVLEQLDIDWEALISPLTGGMLAHQIGRQWRSLFNWGRGALGTQKVALKGYLESEADVLASAAEIDRFADQVDETKLAADRLTARIDRLLQQKQSREKEAERHGQH